MKTKVFKAAQWFLGFFMVVIGINKFFGFIEIPNPPGDGGAVMQVYISSGFLKLIGVLEILGGLTLLTGKMLPIGVTFITAIMFNATVFHALHDLPGIGPAAFCLFLSLVTVFANKDRFSNFFSV